MFKLRLKTVKIAPKTSTATRMHLPTSHPHYRQEQQQQQQQTIIDQQLSSSDFLNNNNNINNNNNEWIKDWTQNTNNNNNTIETAPIDIKGGQQHQVMEPPSNSNSSSSPLAIQDELWWIDHLVARAQQEYPNELSEYM